MRHGLREPPVDGAIHQQIAEEEHEQRGREAQDERAGEQTCPDMGAQQPILAVRIELQYIAAEQHQQQYQQQKDQDG